MINENFYYKLKEKISLADLAEISDYEIYGEINQTELFTNIRTLKDANASDLSFCHNPKYIEEVKITAARICITSLNLKEKIIALNPDLALIICANPYMLYCKILEKFYGIKEFSFRKGKDCKISETAQIADNVFIGDNVTIGDNVKIYPNSTIMPGCQIGDNSIINSNSYIAFSVIGKNVVLQSGARLGTDGFGYFSDHSGHHKITHFGTVIIEDEVEIGANTTIDRGSILNTIIKRGSKIDNLVQIAHNVEIGEHCFLVSQTGIAGSTKVGNFVVFGGQAGIAGHLEIGHMTRFAAQSGVTKDIAANSGDYYGMPAIPKKEWQKEKIAIRKLTRNKN